MKWLPAALCSAYLLLAWRLLGFHLEQAVLVALFLGLYYASGGTRRFILCFSPFLIYWILFDFMKAFPNYRVSPVHIRSLYEADSRLFRVGGLSVNEFFAAHRTRLLDVLSGSFYLCWIPVPLAVGFYLFATRPEQAGRFSRCFLFVNFLGWIVYYTYPAAPPWYVQQYGFDLNVHTPGSAAGLLWWDQALGVHLFRGLYSKSSNVFAAMPSLHSAYPLIALYYGWKTPLKWICGVVAPGIWFAAVYTSQHYVLDVLAGISCAVAGISLFETGRIIFWRVSGSY